LEVNRIKRKNICPNPKCGADNPVGAKFCLNCGARLGLPAKEVFESLFSRSLIVAGSLLGILLAWIGTIVYTFGESNTAVKAAATLNFLGFAFLGTFLICGGISNRDFDKSVRLGMILGGVIMLGLRLGFL